MKRLLLTLLLALAPMAAHAESGPDETRERLAQAARDCSLFGRVYLHLADLRDGGMDESVAIGRGTDYMNERGQTGSHLAAKQYRPAVTRFARYVYSHPELKRETLYMYGLYDCSLSKLVADDAAFLRAQAQLEGALAACQKEFAGAEQAQALGDCGTRAAEDAVRTGRGGGAK